MQRLELDPPVGDTAARATSHDDDGGGAIVADVTDPSAPSAFAQGTAPIMPIVASDLADGSDPGRDLALLEDQLERCLAAIEMHFQPIVHASDRTLFGYESLLRSRDKALPHPGVILDAAERLERVTKLGRAVRNDVARVFATAPASRGIVFINLHALDLFDRSLSSPYSPLTKIASRVVLEITERNSLDGVKDVRYRVAELRALGFRIAVDDLGGGHARMGALQPLDTDFVKLDMSLVRDVDSHPMKQRLVQSITQLCREQGMKVIGEGVETLAEAQTLWELGCDLLQGYLIARPGLPFVDPRRS
jgi:EAL domain-containing protein (putative c-di-GMP-specific phosphodiesterase class I)